MLNSYFKTSSIAFVMAAALSGCAATLDGLREDLGKVGEKAGLNRSATDNEAVETEESELAMIQSLLKEQGYFAGAVDGDFDAETEAAIQDFQLDKGLRVDGRPTTELLSALKSK